MSFKVGDKCRIIKNVGCSVEKYNPAYLLITGVDIRPNNSHQYHYDACDNNGSRLDSCVNCHGDNTLELITSTVEQNNTAEKNHMDKFYRVKKDTYLFTAGAILSNKENSTQYKATDDIWHVEGNETLRKFLDGAPAVAADVVENSPDWFERVYKVSSIRGMAYVVKSTMKDLMSKVAVNKDGEVEAGVDVDDKK